MTTTTAPAPHELWQQAGGDPDQYRQLLADHGHLVPGDPGPAPCGRQPSHPVRVLTLSRPWPWLILHTGKRIENRQWNTAYRGRLLIHAGRSWQGPTAEVFLNSRPELRDAAAAAAMSWHPDDHPTGIVADSRLAGVCSTWADSLWTTCDCGQWAVGGQHHFLLDQVVALGEPVACRGRLGLWIPPPRLLAQVEAELARAGGGVR